MSSLSIIKPPSAQCLPSELFDKWPLPSIHSTITVFTSCSVLLRISPALAILEKHATKGYRGYSRCTEILTENEVDHFIQHQAPLQSKSTRTWLKWQECRHTAPTAVMHKDHCCSLKKVSTLMFIKRKHYQHCPIKREYVKPPPSKDWTMNPCTYTG